MINEIRVIDDLCRTSTPEIINFLEEHNASGTLWHFDFNDGTNCELLEINSYASTPYFKVWGTITPEQKAAIMKYSVLMIKD